MPAAARLQAVPPADGTWPPGLGGVVSAQTPARRAAHRVQAAGLLLPVATTSHGTGKQDAGWQGANVSSHACSHQQPDPAMAYDCWLKPSKSASYPGGGAGENAVRLESASSV